MVFLCPWMAKIPSLSIFTYCYVLAWFNCQWVFAYVLGPPPMPSRSTNNSRLGGSMNGDAPPQQVWEVMNWWLLTKHQLEERGLVGNTQTLWVRARCDDIAAALKGKFFTGAGLECPNPRLNHENHHLCCYHRLSAFMGSLHFCTSLILE